MGSLENALLGVTFWVLGLAGTVLMFRLWGYPFDHDTLKSSAPPALMRLHRLIGYGYLLLYVVLMVQMVPRLWAYQVELPARTVAHLGLGIAVGALLLVKLLIVRFFKQLEGSTVPLLGILLFVCTTVLIGLSVPIALREAYLGREAVGSGPAGRGLQRVRTLLPGAGLPQGVSLDRLATPAGLARGRAVLSRKCVQCHDLRTVLARPRPPEVWVETVRRMAERAVLEPISEAEQWEVSAYLVAISPDLQQSVQRKRRQELSRQAAAEPRMPVPARPARGPAPAARPRSAPESGAPPATFDLAAARRTFDLTCSGCHGADKVEGAPPRSEEEAHRLVARMVENGLFVETGEREQIVRYLTATYVR